MKLMHLIFLAEIALLLSACQPQAFLVTILDGDKIISISSSSAVPAEILTGAKITIGSDDRLLYRGVPTPPETAISDQRNITLTIRRAVALTIATPDGQQTIHTSAFTISQALTEAGFTLHASDRFDPPAETPIIKTMTVTYQPSREIVITVDGTQVRVRSAADTVGQALAEVSFPLIGLDYSDPSESSALPADGQIRLVRVVESVSLTQKTIPYTTRTEPSADLEIDQQALLKGGEPGLAISRLQIRSEDGIQVLQRSENESVVRPPQDRIMGIGTKIVIRTTTVDGMTIEYWRALRLVATSYSPCRSATSDGRCLYGTSSGLPVQRGVVAMVYSWYILFGFEHLYIPNYGYAVVGDVGGGWPNGNHYWVDLGWTDEEYQPMMFENGITVYFLTPVPANPGYILP